LPPLSNRDRRRSRRRGRLFLGLLLLHRTGILAFSLDIAVDKLDHRLGGVVAVAEARLHDAGIAAIAALVARADDVEEFFNLGNVANFGDRLTPGVQSTFFCERHQLLDDRT